MTSDGRKAVTEAPAARDGLSSSDVGSSAWVPDVEGLASARQAHSRSLLGRVLVGVYRFRRLRKLCVRVVMRLEGGVFFSHSLREILQRYHKVVIGRYSYGSILTPGVLPHGTVVGNFCSVGVALIVWRRGHPVERLTQHPFFYNALLGMVTADTIEANEGNPLLIGHDVWIGDRVTILPGCKCIGNGAVIAAGAIVTQDVPAYAIVAGIPARQIKSRFDKETSDALEQSAWWDLPLSELLRHRDLLLAPATIETAAALSRTNADRNKFTQ